MEKKQLAVNERLACTILSKLRYKNDAFYQCRWNDFILNVAHILLKGRNPIEFIGWLLDIDPSIEQGFGNYKQLKGV